MLENPTTPCHTSKTWGKPQEEVDVSGAMPAYLDADSQSATQPTATSSERCKKLSKRKFSALRSGIPLTNSICRPSSVTGISCSGPMQGVIRTVKTSILVSTFQDYSAIRYYAQGTLRSAYSHCVARNASPLPTPTPIVGFDVLVISSSSKWTAVCRSGAR